MVIFLDVVGLNTGSKDLKRKADTGVAKKFRKSCDQSKHSPGAQPLGPKVVI